MSLGPALFALGLLLSAGCSAGRGEVTHRSAAAEGQALFGDPGLSPDPSNRQSCSSCHAAGPGDGRALAGAGLAGAVDRPSYWGGREVDLLRSVDDCMRSFMLAPAGLSPGDPRAAALYAYLAGLAGGDASAQPFTVVAEAMDLPAGDAGRGEASYGRACASCHGARGTGWGRLSAGFPVLPSGARADNPGLSAPSLRVAVIEKTRHGPFLGYGGQMPPFSLEVLSDAELADVLSYLGF